ncbi:prolipoprotein diacylglyceryl transferase [Nocardioides marmorisolisilvae]|uniref:Phosphatidylglycerol--prolipoprotein diacylglyceryl transferase n=1 Tax=Nocardioides marmorisolisilvae TaxID=1542737 RepID=A0A3N0DXV0_9ACTN|nr:prolipoprotein diacylglyceryl transferase [Nocardioides marmorisolisilvae]
MVLASIPSPSQGVWHIGSIPVRAYALCIILGVVAAVWLGEKRWIARGGAAGQVGDIALWGVPFGLVGARLYHVITDHDLYFGAGKDAVGALEIWHGGLGIWGAIAGGVLGGWIGARRHGIKLRPMLDALAPALLLAQAIGRWGNYFNQELFGKPTSKPWGLEIDPAHRPDGYADSTTFHPTFLYECLWNLSAMGVVIYLDRKLRLGFGRCFALYVMAYCLGRGWIEYLRIDNVEYNDVLGLRLNVWTSIVLFTGALIYFVLAGRRHPAPVTREESVYLPGRAPAEDGATAADVAGEDEAGVAAEASAPAQDEASVTLPAPETE